MSGVPDLARIAAEAQRGAQDPWALMVGLPDGKGGQQNVPVPVGIFLMLDALAAQVKRLADTIEAIGVNQIAGQK